jgi:hypothetical protein
MSTQFSKVVVSGIGLLLAAAVSVSTPATASAAVTSDATVASVTSVTANSLTSDWLDGMDQSTGDPTLVWGVDPNAWLQQMDQSTPSGPSLQDMVYSEAYRTNADYRAQVNQLIAMRGYLNRVTVSPNGYYGSDYYYGYLDY